MTGVRVILVAALVALASFALPGWAAASEAHPRQLELERLVMCTTCGRSLDVSTGPSAERERAFLRREIRSGRTRSQVLDDVVAEHGGDTSVLAVPRADRGLGGLAWAGPLVLVLALLVVGMLTTRSWRRRRGQAGVATGTSEATVPDASRQVPAPDVRVTETQ